MNNQETAYQEQMRPHYRWNFAMLMMDTAAFGVLFKALSPNITLTYYLAHFTKSELLVGLISVVGIAGQMMSQLAWANMVNGLTLKKPAFVIGTVISRGSLLLFLLSTVFWGRLNSALPVVAFFVCYGTFSLSNGLLSVVWSNFVAKSVSHNRGAFLGLSYSIDGVIGVGVALLLRYLLRVAPFPTNYIYIFGVLSAFAVVTMLPAALYREIPYPEAQPVMRIREYGRELGTILRTDVAYTGLLVARVIVTCAEMSVPFYALYAIKAFGIGTKQIGDYNILMIAAGVLANSFWGFVGDRAGFKTVFQSAFVVGLIMAGMAFVAGSPTLFYLLFFLQGAYTAAIQMSTLSLNLEISPPDKTPLYVGLANAITGIGLCASPLVGAAIATHFGYRPLFAASMVIYVLDFIFLTWFVKHRKISVTKQQRCEVTA
ncbi:MAG: MFS transporter [Firmicutes bacterium]|nr:MFS transporter [Bacillota bacterium]